MGVRVPPKVPGVGRHVKTIASVVILLCSFYIGFTSIHKGWLGAVNLIPYVIVFGWGFWREVKEEVRKKRFDAHLNAEQLTSILDLRRVVEDVEAHTERKRTWKNYSTRQYWRLSKLPSKPSLAEIETAFKESEEAVGPYDINVPAAFINLLEASRSQKDLDLERMMMEKYIHFFEHMMGNDNEILIPGLARAGQLHFAAGEYERSAEELTRAVELQNQHQRKDPNCRALMERSYFMCIRKTRAMAYFTAKDYEAAEPLCVELLTEAEQEEGMLNTEPWGTQMVRGMLIGVYVKRGWKALAVPEDVTSANVVLRYLRDALILVAVHPSFYAHNLKQVGSLFIRAGRIADGNMTFRLANTVHEAGKRSGVQQRNCLCSIGEVEKHEFKRCDACSNTIGLGDRWFFCRTCADVDLCAECYVWFGKGKDDEWIDVGKFPRKCWEHEFYEVREDEKAEGVKVEQWMAEMIQVLSLELKDAGRGSGASVRQLQNVDAQC
ncbi:uncharacterized protein N0V89_003506 [Didymosphaeria variabile]|uniref:ZZ-type domain-containing protein n=1 Tax=Didymosphaeria variabile TaxID=1932322 RepID=A0A9W8XQN8_9PLEO|nr:uncharacterized protein N0V89_003506 [Didymosphaeria variabile]KAJ4355490.1 hypothetical protein N0V89_003506 [Didymosphaeria variabile]